MATLNPESPDQISAEWLNSLLQREGYLDKSIVENVEISQIGVGKSWLSTVSKLKVEYSSSSALLPNSYILKMLSKSEFRDLNYELGAYEREIKFYKELAQEFPIRLPKIFCSEFSSDSNFMLMEDLSYMTEGDLVLGLTYKEALSTVERLAKVHAKFWNSSVLNSLKWLPGSNNLHNDYANNWKSFTQLCGDFIDSESLQIGEQLKLNINWLMSEIDNRPHTLVHDDMKADNLLFDSRDKENEVVILDWQFVIKSLGVIDVARLIGGSMTPQIRDNKQYELLKVWYEKLIDEGVSGYTWEEAQRDFKLAALYCLTFPVHFHKGIVRAKGRALEYIKSFYSRLFLFASEIEADTIFL